MTNDPLLTLEESHHLWEPEVRGVKLWSLIRQIAVIDAVSQKTGYVPFTRTSRRAPLSSARMARYARTLRLLVSPAKGSYDGLFFVNGLTRYPFDGATSYDRLHESYFRLFDNPLILEMERAGVDPLPDHRYEANLFSQAALSFWALAQAKRIRLTPSEHQTILDFAHDTAALYGMPQNQPRFANAIVGVIRRAEALRVFLQRWIIPKLAEPYFALVTNAFYLGREALITRTLNDAGFTVTEAQHGLISQHHYVYSLPPDVLQSPNHPARRYLPQILFTFGDYWSGQTRVPAETISIGSPHLAQKILSLRDVSVVEKQILVLSGDARALELAGELARAFPRRPLVFKLHPAETHLLETYAARLPYPNVQVTGSGDVYQMIAASEIIVGHSTTALIEAVAFPGKRIFYHDPEFIPADVGAQFHEAADLIDLINDPARGFPTTAPEKYWPMDVDERLARFAAERLGRSVPHAQLPG